MNEIHFDFLDNRKKDIDLVANWVYSEWGHLVPNRSYENLCAQFHSRVNIVHIDMVLLEPVFNHCRDQLAAIVPSEAL